MLRASTRLLEGRGREGGRDPREDREGGEGRIIVKVGPGEGGGEEYREHVVVPLFDVYDFLRRQERVFWVYVRVLTVCVSWNVEEVVREE